LILIDTHAWVWWADGDAQLSVAHRRAIADAEGESVGLSVISCWEVAKLVEVGKLTLAIPVREWIDAALALPGVALLPLTPTIAVESTQLPGTFHRDPADQIIVATARVHDIPLLTLDAKILAYSEVKKVTFALGS
jgi:PIN domain nuclease of toxin-antitoxin system